VSKLLTKMCNLIYMDDAIIHRPYEENLETFGTHCVKQPIVKVWLAFP